MWGYAQHLLSNFTPGVETNVFQQSNLTQSHKDEYEDIQQIEDFVASTFDSDSWVNNDEELKEDIDDNTSFLQPQIWLMAVTNFQIREEKKLNCLSVCLCVCVSVCLCVCVCV